jgi:hypothetical protein
MSFWYRESLATVLNCYLKIMKVQPLPYRHCRLNFSIKWKRGRNQGLCSSVRTYLRSQNADNSLTLNITSASWIDKAKTGYELRTCISREAAWVRETRSRQVNHSIDCPAGHLAVTAANWVTTTVVHAAYSITTTHKAFLLWNKTWSECPLQYYQAQGVPVVRQDMEWVPTTLR